MTPLHPFQLSEHWPSVANVERLRDCLKFLYYHGFVTDLEQRKIEKRAQKWVDKHEGRK